ncbi:MAG: TlpA disulfide reductase family protein [Bacteroidota bacterium]|nr:TlpA disulfide reductase family protein [Bacteroidota bacterium]
MKHLIFVLIPALVLFSCKPSAKEGNFTITGTIENGSGKQIILSNIGSRQVNPLDTVEISDDGEFSFGQDVEASDFFILQLMGGQEAITVIGGPDVHMTITADANSFGEYTVEGSKDSELMWELNNQLDSTLNKIKGLSAKMQAAQDDTSKRSQITAEYMKIAEGHEAYLTKFIDENKSSLSALIALSHSLAPRTTVLNVRDHKAYFDKVDQALLKAHPKSQAAISLHEYMDQINNPQPKPQSGISTGTVAPDIEMPNPVGKKIKLSSTRGNYVLLDFWAGWCRPCREESPNLVEAYNKYHEKGFEIYQVSLDKERKQWLDAIEKDNLSVWIHVSDLDFWQTATAQRYGVRAIPANFLLDPQGKVIATNLRGSALNSKLKEIFKF